MQRRGRQTKRMRRRIRWGRFLPVLFAFIALVGLIFFVVRLLTGGLTLDAILPGATPSPALPPVALATSSPAPTARPLPEKIALSPSSNLDDLGVTTELMINGENADSFTREGDLRFGSDYTDIPGIITFGGNNLRNTFSYGTQNVSQRSFEIISEEKIGSLKTNDTEWSGACFTGMPIIVEWPETTRKQLGIKDEFKNKEGLTEVIYPTADGYIYFLELTTGVRTRDPIDIGAVTKGTASLDPRGYPLLYVGQGDISRNSSGRSGAWFRIIDLISNKVIWDFGQRDPFSYREWQGYSSSALVHQLTDTLIIPGENGILYTIKLNTEFSSGQVSVNPGALEKYRYTGEGYAEGADAANKRIAGVYGSASVFRNYAFFTDNGGLLQCVDLNSLKLEYALDVSGASDSTPVIEEDPANHTFYIYTGSKVAVGSSKNGPFYHRKINGITGETIWENESEASYGDGSGGARGTPHVGRNKLKDYVIFNSTFVTMEAGGVGGRITTYEKESGKIISEYEQEAGYWSSPVVIYDSGGNGYLIQCDRSGIMRMHNPLDLSIIYAEIDLGSRIEATPAVFNDHIVVGTRGSDSENAKIFIVKIG